MAKKLKLITRIEDVERATDVKKMTQGELEYHASRCPQDVKEKLKTLTDAQLHRIVNGERYEDVINDN